MKTKIIPFGLETANEIQKGKIKGKIVRNGREVIILDYNSKNHLGYPIRIVYMDKDEVDYVNCEGLHIEVFCNEPQFKPFDRVLVRNDDEEIWQPRLYEMYSGGTEKHYCQDGHGYIQCIPYDGNQDLVGTTKKPKED